MVSTLYIVVSIADSRLAFNPPLLLSLTFKVGAEVSTPCISQRFACDFNCNYAYIDLEIASNFAVFQENCHEGRRRKTHEIREVSGGARAGRPRGDSQDRQS